MRTFSRQDWDASRDRWRDFSDEWGPFRKLAAERGMIYPPEGTALDSWADDEPSQRAILVRAIRETPKLLRDAIGHSRTWGEVVARVIRQHREWRELDDLEDAYTRRERAEVEPTGRQAVQSIAAILSRISDSA